MPHQRQLRLGFDGGTERNEAGTRRSDVIHHYAPTKGRLGPKKKKIEKQRGDGGNRTETGSAFTECPLCGRKVALSTAERHVEECLARGGQNPKPPRSTRRDETEAKVDLGPLVPHEGELSGQYTWLNFISVEEEADLVAYLDAGRRQEWIPKTFNGLAFHKNWGLEVDLRGRTINPARHPMPPILTRLCERMRERGGGVLGTFRPDEANAIDYRKSLGHSLTPHFDDRQLNGDVLCNLCLVSDCAMTYTVSHLPNPSPHPPLQRPWLSLFPLTRWLFQHLQRNPRRAAPLLLRSMARRARPGASMWSCRAGRSRCKPGA